MRWRSTVLAAAVLSLLVGCSHSSGSGSVPTHPAPSPTYPLPPRPVRLSETPLASAAAVSGQVTVAVIGLRAHMALLAGTHADFAPRGEFDRLRVAVQNDTRSFVFLTLSNVLLVTADGVAHRPDAQAMIIKRQPEEIDVGSQDGVQFDVYYDVPKGSKLRLLRLTDVDPVAEVALPAT